MPQAIAIPIASFLGGGTFAAFTATVISGAIVGAAIGGISAAVMGGSISKGLLYGAVGGAVAGGISGALGGATEIAGKVALDAAVASPTSIGTSATTSLIKQSYTGAASKGFSIGSSFASLGGDMTGAALVGTAGEMLKGAFAPDAEKVTEDTQAHEKELLQMKLDAEKQMAEIAAGAAGGGGSEDHSLEIAKLNQQTQREQLAEQSRQYDVQNQLEAERQQRQAYAVTNLKAARETDRKPTAPSIDQQAYNAGTLMYAQQTPQPVQSIQQGVLKEPVYAA
jgi:hypothetical protein